LACRGTQDRWAKAFLNYESITVPVIESISRRPARECIVLLAGGDKRTQDRDIKKAIQLARDL
jgi:hypothetical protein